MNFAVDGIRSWYRRCFDTITIFLKKWNGKVSVNQVVKPVFFRPHISILSRGKRLFGSGQQVARWRGPPISLLPNFLLHLTNPIGKAVSTLVAIQSPPNSAAAPQVETVNLSLNPPQFAGFSGTPCQQIARFSMEVVQWSNMARRLINELESTGIDYCFEHGHVSLTGDSKSIRNILEKFALNCGPENQITIPFKEEPQQSSLSNFHDDFSTLSLVFPYLKESELATFQSQVELEFRP